MKALDYIRRAFWMLVIALVVIVIASGCSNTEQSEPTEPGRFTMETQRMGFDCNINIFTDTETNKQYMFVDSGYAGGLVLLETVEMSCLEPEEPELVEEEEPTRYALTDAERTLVEQVVMAESGGEPYCGQVAIAQCILTACEKEGMRPSEVVREYQYTPKRPKPSESVSEAVSAVFDRGEVAFRDEPLWFYAYKSGQSDFHERQRYLGTVGGHRFFAEKEV